MQAAECSTKRGQAIGAAAVELLATAKPRNAKAGDPVCAGDKAGQPSERLEKAGADLVSLSERIDTPSASSKMVFRMPSRWEA